MLKYALIAASMLFSQLSYSADFQTLTARLTSQGDVLTRAAADKASDYDMKELANVIAGHEDIRLDSSASEEVDKAYMQIIRSRLTRSFLESYYEGNARKAVAVTASFSLVGSGDYPTVISRLKKQGDILADYIAAKASDDEVSKVANAVAGEVGMAVAGAGNLDKAYEEILRIKVLRGVMSNYYPKEESRTIIVEACLASIGE